MEQNIDLSGLRDIHIPLQPNFFPLALGWWILIILLIVLSLFTYFVIFSKTHSLKRQVWREERSQLYKRIFDDIDISDLIKEIDKYKQLTMTSIETISNSSNSTTVETTVEFAVSPSKTQTKFSLFLLAPTSP